jgi:hypothetical protein
MRHAAALLVAALLAPPAALAEGYGLSLTVLLDFQEAASPEYVAEMQREIQQLFKPAGLRVQLRLSTDVRTGDSFDGLVLVKFRGNCGAPVDPMLMDERGPGPLAFAHTAGGRIQPFSEVACETVRRAVESALWGGERRNRERLFGRALGRVVAHELVHILGQSHTHGRSGAFRASLSGAELIADRLEFSGEDLVRVRRARIGAD